MSRLKKHALMIFLLAPLVVTEVHAKKTKKTVSCGWHTISYQQHHNGFTKSDGCLQGPITVAIRKQDLRNGVLNCSIKLNRSATDGYDRSCAYPIFFKYQ